jgi:hypothetical protein
MGRSREERTIDALQREVDKQSNRLSRIEQRLVQTPALAGNDISLRLPSKAAHEGQETCEIDFSACNWSGSGALTKASVDAPRKA